jgi:hypothetical protein
MRILFALLASSLLVACGGTTPPATAPENTIAPAPTAPATPEPTPAVVTPPPVEPPPVACAGPVATPPAGLVKEAEAPPAWSIGAPGKGSLCEGQVFVAKEPVTVYRVFSASWKTSKLAGPTGAYWTLEKPSGTAAQYRTTYEICQEWNDLDMLNECKIEKGAKVILGPGQSAACEKSGGSFPGNAANQLVIVKKADGSVPVTGCKESAQKWAPGAAAAK